MRSLERRRWILGRVTMVPRRGRGGATAASVLAAGVVLTALPSVGGAQSPQPLPQPAPQPAVPSAPAVPAPIPSQPPSAPPTTAAGALGAYRAPTIALVQPALGAGVPQDRPVVVFRFSQGEAHDPVDLASFSVVVDGELRTPLFQLSGGAGGGEAWGPLVQPGDARLLAAGAHQVTARVCSSRGACGSTQAQINVLAPAAADTAKPPGAAQQKRGLGARLANLLLSAAERLLDDRRR